MSVEDTGSGDLPAPLSRLVRTRGFKIAVGCFLILLPFIISSIYNAITGLPGEVRIATGPEGGMYHRLSRALAKRIERDLGVHVRRIQTRGSLENLLLLQEGRVDFALYQPGTLEIFRQLAPEELHLARIQRLIPTVADPDPVEFIANLYSQPVHLFVRRGSGITTPVDLRGRSVALGLDLSGDHAAGLALLHHFGLEGQVDARALTYGEIDRAFREALEGKVDRPLDAAFITVGPRAKVFETLSRSSTCSLVDIPASEALSRKLLYFYPHRIPAGLYAWQPERFPRDDIHTLAAGAHLLTRESVNTTLVEEVTRIVLDKEFISANGLGELYRGGREFAMRKPSHPFHPGAINYYDPELRPPLNPDFVEAIEGMQSFVFAVIIAVFLGTRWLLRRRARRKAHKLDRYMRQLLDIEARQLPLDQGEGWADIKPLNDLLDEVSRIRQEALRDVTAHELEDNRAVDCFISMCHALSDKISAKISRQRFDRAVARLANGTPPASGRKKGERRPRPRGTR